MPAAVSGNAVASVKGGFQLFSLMGVGPRKTWDDVTNQIYVMTLSRSGKVGQRPRCSRACGPLERRRRRSERIGRPYGRLVVDNQGAEITVPDVNVYEPGARRWSRGKDIPVPVDSAAIGVMRDRFIY